MSFGGTISFPGNQEPCPQEVVRLTEGSRLQTRRGYSAAKAQTGIIADGRWAARSVHRAVNTQFTVLWIAGGGSGESQDAPFRDKRCQRNILLRHISLARVIALGPLIALIETAGPP